MPISAADLNKTLKDILRVAFTSGQSRDVIDILRVKADQLTEEVSKLAETNTALLLENHRLKLENESLKQSLNQQTQQVPYTPAKRSEYDPQTLDILKLFFNGPLKLYPSQVAQHLKLNLNVVRHHFDLLSANALIESNVVLNGGVMGYGITSEGRRFIIENRLNN